MKIGVLGAGAYGSAMAKILRENGHTVKFYDPYKYPAISLEETVNWARILLIAVPTNIVSSLIKQLPESAFKKPLLVTTKGVMTLKHWEKFNYFEIISGPGFADEIEKKKQTKLTVAAHGAEQGTTLAEDLLEAPYIKFDKTEDVKGVILAAGLKNIYAIEAGRLALSFGSKDFKEYIMKVEQESEKFLLNNGGFVETMRKNAGLGDLMLTCGSEKSRNYCFGGLLGGRRRVLERKRLIRKYLRENTVEGLSAIKEIEKHGLTIPRENEILIDIIRRVKNVAKR